MALGASLKAASPRQIRNPPAITPPGEIYRNEPLKPDTRRVFESATTGPVGDEPHRYDKEHREYTQAVKEAFGRFKAENGITSENMTPEQAKEFVNEVRRSPDSRIRNLNMKIIRSQFRFFIRRGGRGE